MPGALLPTASRTGAATVGSASGKNGTSRPLGCRHTFVIVNSFSVPGEKRPIAATGRVRRRRVHWLVSHFDTRRCNFPTSLPSLAPKQAVLPRATAGINIRN